MSSSLLRGLRALESIASEPMGVSEIARRLDVDKAGVSRMLAALHAEGWVLRTGALYVLGERALSMVAGDPADVRHRAERIADHLHGETGLSASVVRLAGSASQPLAVRSDDAVAWLDPPEPFEHLWGTAGGLALLAQLPDREIERRLDVHPWPTAPPGPPGPDAVWAIIRSVRAGGTAEERGWAIPGIGCIAMPWPVAEPGPPHAALVLGDVDSIDEDADAIRRVLKRAVLTWDSPPNAVRTA